MTKIGETRIHEVRARGGNKKFRALKLDSGNFSWGTEVCTRKVRVLDVTYNASNNELVRTKTLVKGAIIVIDAHPFKTWYEGHYGVKIGIKKKTDGEEATLNLEGKSEKVQAKLKSRFANRTLEQALDHQFDQAVAFLHSSLSLLNIALFTIGSHYSRNRRWPTEQRVTPGGQIVTICVRKIDTRASGIGSKPL